jgi:hypothetical protein
MKNFIKYLLAAAIALIAALIIFLFVGKTSPQNVVWGINFSQGFAESLNDDWRANYSAILNDLNAKNIRLGTNWDLLQPERGKFHWDDLDWQVKEAEKAGASLIIVLGIKTPRWPECHIPSWAESMSEKDIGAEIVNLISATVERYKDSPAVKAWQVENEPFFRFGECPSYSANFVNYEVAAVKKNDPLRPVLITASGELSPWIKEAATGDIVGTTLYRNVWFSPLEFYFNYHFPPIFYARKAWLIKTLFGKDVIDVELQAEPWTDLGFQKTPLEEQFKSFNMKQFSSNIEFARETGLKEAYLWGAEWWYWMDKKQHHPEYWEFAKTLFAQRR